MQLYCGENNYNMLIINKKCNLVAKSNIATNRAKKDAYLGFLSGRK